MEASVIIPVWQVVVYIIIFAGSYTVIAYMTKQNYQEIQLMKKLFVSKELYINEITHINNTLDEIKAQNIQILEKLSK